MRMQREIRLQLELKELEREQQKAALARERRLRQIAEVSSNTAKNWQCTKVTRRNTTIG